MRAVSPFFASVLLLVAITFLSNFVTAARYDEPFEASEDKEAARPWERMVFRSTLEEALRGQHHFPVESYPSAEVFTIDEPLYRVHSDQFWRTLRGTADQRRFVILEAPFPYDVSQKGFSAAFHVNSYKDRPDQHLVGYLSAVDTGNELTGEKGTPKVYFHGFSVVRNAPELKTRLFSHTKQLPEILPKGHIVTFRELMGAIEGGIRGW